MRKRQEFPFGRVNEEYFFKVFSRKPRDAPSWFVSVRRANKTDDRRGFDAFVRTTDVGEIPVQIKSSKKGIMRFYARRPGNLAVPIVVMAGLSYMAIRKRTFELVGKRRVKLLEQLWSGVAR